MFTRPVNEASLPSSDRLTSHHPLLCSRLSVTRSFIRSLLRTTHSSDGWADHAH
nr:MAG TPA: hypothetical protein [Caudoviricetes sp.]